MFVYGLDGLQHVLPVQLSLQWIHSATFLQPPVQIQVSALHQHVYIASRYFTAIDISTVRTFLIKQFCVLMFYKKKVATWLCLLVIQLDDVIAVLLQVVQMLNFIFITFCRLIIGLQKVDIFQSK